MAAKVTASLVALVNAYFGNRQWAFRHRERRRVWVEISLFLAVNAFCTALGALIVWAGVEWMTSLLGHSGGAVIVNVINLVSIVIVVMVRFAFYHWVVSASRRASVRAVRRSVGRTIPSRPGIPARRS